MHTKFADNPIVILARNTPSFQFKGLSSITHPPQAYLPPAIPQVSQP